MTGPHRRSVIVVGAGIVGTVFATLLTQQGYDVRLFERHADPRGCAPRAGKSVNLTLCTRGFAALDAVGIGDEIRALSVPVYGRVIHAADGSTEAQPYGSHRECLYSISRHRLWLALLDLVDQNGVPMAFGRGCLSVDPSLGEIVLDSGERLRSDLVIAADGARSAIRHALLARPQVQYSQRYADHANKELYLPPDCVQRAGLDHHALHIWPRGEFMLIAFPNLDGSLTATLHLPLEGDPSFGAIRDPAALEALFSTYFADVRPLMPTLVEDYFSHPEIPMVTVRCSPLVTGRLALIGDAAHAVWPSYGQGANSGFEGCLLLAECLARGSVEEALARYDHERQPDASAIADLSEDHFEEIRDSVGDPKFHDRKRLERRLNELYPEHYVPLYVRVSFSRMPYAQAVRIEKRQKRLIDDLLAVVADPSKPDLDAPAARRAIHQYLETP